MTNRTGVKKVTRALPWFAALAVMGCLLDDNTALETQLTLTVDQTPRAVGETFTFTYSATGTAIHRVVVDFGDGAMDADTTFNGGTSTEMDGAIAHAYAAAGSYTVTGWIEDLAVGADTVIIAVEVN